MSRRYRIILLTITFVVLALVGLIIEGDLSNLVESFWFTSGFLLLILLSLVDQPFFSKDSNIFVNAITAGLSLLLVPVHNRNMVFYFFLVLIVYLALSSYILMIIRKNQLRDENIAIQFFSRFNRILGKPDVIFSAFFLWGATVQYASNTVKFNSLLLFWVVFLLLNVPELSRVIEKIFEKKEKIKSESIGAILGVQSQNTFLVKLNSACKNVNLFRFVEFKYSVDANIRRGLICNMMLLDQEQWIKVITNKEIDELLGQNNYFENHINDLVYLIEETPCCSFVSRFVGIVTEGSTIGKVKFLYNTKVKISEGDMIETTVSGTKVLYQIVEGKTQIELLANKNQLGYIVGEGILLGTWNMSKLQFDKFGWVPEINSPIYLASDIEKIEVSKDEVVLGNLPGTNYPVVINKEIAITHHMAIIGVTGTGKSVFSRNIVREYLKDEDVKVICIDFTGEYGVKFKDLVPKPIVDETISGELFSDIDFIQAQMDCNYGKDTKESIIRKKKVFESISEKIELFLKDENNKLSLFELPEVENTSGVMMYTQVFFRALFKLAKTNNNYGKRVCLVLEEAHTIIPEWNSAGISEKVSQPLINSIAQIALQGRKYNIGLLVIAQRTANVSKTILTQCNSIISFQEYDKTSIDFLANYFGQDISSSLTKLKFRQAVAAGKAFRSSIPMIFEVPEIVEK